MPVKYVVLNRGTLVLELWTGTISHDELLGHERRLLSDSSIAQHAVLADAIDASFETTPEAVHELTDLYRQSAENVKVRKAALLINESAYERARLYENLGVRMILFNTLEVACVWLGIDVAAARKELEQLRGHASIWESGVRCE